MFRPIWCRTTDLNLVSSRKPLQQISRPDIVATQSRYVLTAAPVIRPRRLQIHLAVVPLLNTVRPIPVANPLLAYSDRSTRSRDITLLLGLQFADSAGVGSTPSPVV